MVVSPWPGLRLSKIDSGGKHIMTSLDVAGSQAVIIEKNVIF
jgi:hypothetical protein